MGSVKSAQRKPAHIVSKRVCETPGEAAERVFQFLGLEWREEYLAMERGLRYENVYGGAVSREYAEEFATRLRAVTQDRILRLTCHIAD